MEKVKSNLIIKLNVTCPHCDNYFDLLTDTDLNDEGWLLSQVIDDHEGVECCTTCPSCNVEFEVDCEGW